MCSSEIKEIPYTSNTINDIIQNSSSFDDVYSYLNKFFTKEQLIKFDNEMNIDLLDVIFTKKHCMIWLH